LVANFQGLDFVSNGMHNTCRFMTKDHGRFDDKVADTALYPVMHI